MSENVGIVIVSHSADVARGTALMVEQMVGREVPLGWCGGDPGGGLGTSVEAIMAAIERAWSEKGVAILVDPPRPVGKSVRLNITLADDLLEKIDRHAEANGLTRSGFLARAARLELDRTDTGVDGNV